MFLSFLKRKRERDFANISDRLYVHYDRYSPFLTVTMTVPDRYHDRSRPFPTVPETVRNGHGNGERSGTLNGQERLGTFES